ncbi:hypothetical protein D3C72_2335450 [compost metagenome]
MRFPGAVDVLIQWHDAMGAQLNGVSATEVVTVVAVFPYVVGQESVRIVEAMQQRVGRVA